jgi:hypothetical protein
MRIYKIKNKEIFNKAKELLKTLANNKKETLRIIKEEITPFKWTHYVGHEPGFHLLTTYIGFKPKKTLEELPEGWRFDKDYPEFLVPNRRKKKGKELDKKLEQLPNYSFNKIEQTLGVSLVSSGRFTIPKLRISKNKKHIFLITDTRSKLDKKDFKEVTLTYANEKLGIKN